MFHEICIWVERVYDSLIIVFYVMYLPNYYRDPSLTLGGNNICRWFTTRLQYPHCRRIGDIVALQQANM